MSFKRTLIYTLTATSLAVTGQSQAGDLLDIYQQALASDPQLKAAEYTYKADAEVASQNFSELLPDINFQADAGYRDSDPSRNVDGNEQVMTLALTQPIFRATEWFNWKTGEVLEQRAQITFSQSQQALVRRVISAYLDVLQAQSIYKSNVSEEAAFTRRLEQTEAQFDVGLIAKTDVEEAKSSRDLSRVDRIIAKGELDKSFESLDRLTGQNWREIDDLRNNYPVDVLVPNEYDPWVEKALLGNLSLQIANLDVETALKTRNATDAQHYPTLDLVANYSNTNNSSYDPDQDGAYIGLTLNLPLYQGGGTSSNVREAYHRWDASIQTQDDTRRAVIQETRSLFRDLNTDVEAVAARRQAIISSESALEAIEAGYEVGTRDFVDVLDAEREVFAARRDYQTSRYTYIRNLIAFKEALGTLSPSDLQRLDSWLTANQEEAEVQVSAK